MSLKAEDVTAVIVTRGDVDLEPILRTFPYPSVIVWDNSVRLRDFKVAGRWLASVGAQTEVIYFQDDDVIFKAHDELLAAYRPGELTVNMPSPWYEQVGYDKWHCAQVGAGSLVPRGIHKAAFALYLAKWPDDDLFLTYTDEVVGMLTPFTRHDFGYTILPHASAPGRISTTEGHNERRSIMLDRLRALRDV